VGTAQRIAHYLHNQGHDVIVSLVAPYIDQREDFKKLMGENLIEIYVHTSEPRERDHFKAIAYVAPWKILSILIQQKIHLKRVLIIY